MNWLASNLTPLSILALVALIIFFASFMRLKIVDTNWRVFKLAGALLAILLFGIALGVVQVFRGPAGQIETVDEEGQIAPLPELPKTALERLRLDWDSSYVANWPAAETLADISEIAYLPPHDAEKSFNQIGFSKVMPVVQGSMIGYVITGEDVTVVVFRGTDFTEVSDWLANLTRSPIDTPHGQAHKGFYDAYQSMKSQVDAILKERDLTHLWITGHSLGGALGLVCAYDLQENEQRQLKGIITFGQPMVARREFADYIDSAFSRRYARFVNRDDIVPKVPPSHVPCGSLVWFTDSGIKRSKNKQVIFGTAASSDSIVDDAPTLDASDQAEIEPLTDAEFETLRMELRMQNAAVERLPEGTPMMTLQATASPFDDHSMLLYLDKIRTLLGLNVPDETQ